MSNNSIETRSNTVTPAIPRIVSVTPTADGVLILRNDGTLFRKGNGGYINGYPPINQGEECPYGKVVSVSDHAIAVIAGTEDCSVRMYDLDTHVSTYTISTWVKESDRCDALTYDPRGGVLAYTVGNTLKAKRIDGTDVYRFEAAEETYLNAIAFGPPDPLTGESAYIICGGESLYKVYPLHTSRPPVVLRSNIDTIVDIQIKKDTTVYVLTVYGEVHMFQLSPEGDIAAGISPLIFSMFGKMQPVLLPVWCISDTGVIAVGIPDERTVGIYDLKRGSLLDTISTISPLGVITEDSKGLHTYHSTETPMILYRFPDNTTTYDVDICAHLAGGKAGIDLLETPVTIPNTTWDDTPVKEGIVLQGKGRTIGVGVGHRFIPWWDSHGLGSVIVGAVPHGSPLLELEGVQIVETYHAMEEVV